MSTTGRSATSTDVGLLIVRVGLGTMFLVRHGWSKLVGGPEKWAKLGTAMEHVGVEFWPTFWGFWGAFAEAGGGVLLALGLLFRPAAAMMAFTMLVATMATSDNFANIGRASHSIEVGLVFLGLVFIGPGRLALDPLIAKRIRRRAS